MQKSRDNVKPGPPPPRRHPKFRDADEFRVLHLYAAPPCRISTCCADDPQLETGGIADRRAARQSERDRTCVHVRTIVLRPIIAEIGGRSLYAWSLQMSCAPGDWVFFTVAPLCTNRTGLSAFPQCRGFTNNLRAGPCSQVSQTLSH